MRYFTPPAMIFFASLGMIFLGSLEADPIEAASIANEAKEAYFDSVKVFQSCPIIYSILILMSIIALSIWLYSMITLRSSEMMPKKFIQSIRELFAERRFETALTTCKEAQNYSARIIEAGIFARKHGAQVMMEAMHAEGKRAGLSLWQRISLLNEIAVVAPMLGLLGTVVGLFFAFYDSSQSADSIASIFDGLGIAIGTTVVGLIVSILAMMFYTTLKFRVVNLLNAIENETLSLVAMIDPSENANSKNPNHS